ncbi:MAG: polysaccharide pyruvyl transferase family protein [Aristaeellaceae bacterium]
MARIGVITFLHNENYGSTLQAWALQRTLEDLGMEAEHIDYRPSREEKLCNLLTSGNSPRLVLEGLRKRSVKAARPGAREKAASFDAFYREHMRLSPACANHAALRSLAKQYDLLLCGSDQIWSPVWLNPAYFLDFAAPGQPRLAYAPSLGVSRLDNPRKARRMARLLEGYAALSVREKEGAALLEAITGKDAAILPDPVLLIGRERWLTLADMPPVDNSPYLLCYFIGDSPAYWEAARRTAERQGLPVRVLPVTEASYQQGLPLADGASPTQWLGHLAGAAAVCTDSFHGAAFATLLHKPLYLQRRYREDDPESKNSRIDQLLRTCYGDMQPEHADWDAVDQRLAQARAMAIDWLKEAVTAALPAQGAGARQDTAIPL